MEEVWWWIMDIIGPAVLLILLIWLVFRQRAKGKADRETTYKATKAEYADEERRRREGTDGL